MKVGPILMTGPVADAIVAALRLSNAGLSVDDRGAYLRVATLDRCVLRADDVAAQVGRPFRLPEDLEAVMVSFRGRLAFAPGEVSWTAASIES